MESGGPAREATAKIAISILLCSRNPRDAHIDRVLEALQRQTLPSTRWELLLIDNASDAPLAGRRSLAWHPNGRHLRVDRIGQLHGLVEGVAAARGEILVTLDDDNVLDGGFLEELAAFFERHPFVGVVNGRVRGEFDREPPAWSRRFMQHLAVRDLGEGTLYSLMPGFDGISCWGAGMGLRREVARHWVDTLERDPRHYRFCRTGDSLIGGQDGDMALCAFPIGLAQAYDGKLALTHIVPANRLEPGYMRQLVYSNRYAMRLLELLWSSPSLRLPPRWSLVGGGVRDAIRDGFRVLTGTRSIEECRLERASRRGARDAEREYRGWLRGPAAPGAAS